MKNILVAGGAGFLGSHLCEQLLSRGHRVFCIDNFYTGSPDNVAHLTRNPRFRLIEHSILKPVPMRDRLDEIYNLACPASPVHYQRDPHYTLMVSVAGVSNLLGLARKHKAKLLQCSTSEVYGDPLNEVQTETDWGNVNCIGPRACYDEGKRCAETLLFDEWRAAGRPIKVARIFNTYGPRMQENDGRIVSNFLVQALKGLPITIYGDGKQTRSFCYVDDLIDGLMRLMETPDEVIGPVNLGNPHELSALSLAHRIAQLLNVTPSIVFRPLPVDDPKRRCPDISRAKALLDWEPRTPLDEGLRRTAAYFNDRFAGAARPRRKAPARKEPAGGAVALGAVPAAGIT